MKRISYIFLSIFFLFALNAQGEHNIMFDKANELYHNKNYDSAGKLYQQMIDDGYVSAELYYNTGNAFYRNNQIGLSIWCFHKALELNKKDKNYKDNLLLAQKRIKEPIDEVETIFFLRWWKNFYTFFSVNSWALLALSFFLLAFLMLFVKKIKPELKMPRGFTAFCFSFSALCLCMMLFSSYQENYHYRAIIIEPKTMMTFQSKKDPIFISEGIEVTVVDEESGMNQTLQSNYLKVKLPDGRIGRMSKSALKKL